MRLVSAYVGEIAIQASFAQYTPLMWFSKRRIYLDYASAPPVLSEAVHAMREAENLVGNPGAIHAEGVAAKKSLEGSRARIAALLGCKAREIVFTSGLTEANNLAILGFAKKRQFLRSDLRIPRGRTSGCSGTHWIVGSIEHDSVLESFAEVECLGGTVTHATPDSEGIVRPETIARSLRPKTVFVSIGWANNEIGTIQPLSQIARVIREHEAKYKTQIIFHSDAGQAPLYLPTLVHSLGVDLLALGANKLYGPHGIGALYKSNRAELASLVVGGKQESGLRAGTESVAHAAGFATAYEKIGEERLEESLRLRALRDQLARALITHIPGLIVNGDSKRALPHMLNISIPDSAGWQTSEYVTLALDVAGIAVSTKSACREGEESRSHVVAALEGSPPSGGWRAANTIRFSLGRGTRAKDIERVLKTLVRVLENVKVRP